MNTEDSPFHGWRASGADKALHIGHLPTRKAVVLYSLGVVDGVNTVQPLAYFVSEEAAHEALALIDGLVALLVRGTERQIG